MNRRRALQRGRSSPTPGCPTPTSSAGSTTAGRSPWPPSATSAPPTPAAACTGRGPPGREGRPARPDRARGPGRQQRPDERRRRPSPWATPRPWSTWPAQYGRSEDPIIRQRIARLHAVAETARLTALRARADARAGRPPGAESSLGYVAGVRSPGPPGPGPRDRGRRRHARGRRRAARRRGRPDGADRPRSTASRAAASRSSATSSASGCWASPRSPRSTRTRRSASSGSARSAASGRTWCSSWARDPGRDAKRAAGTKAGGSSRSVLAQMTRTFWASSPLRPGATSNSTVWPSSRDL